MFKHLKDKSHFRRIFETLYTFSAIVLIWRGVWVALDWVDHQLFGGNHIVTATLGIVLGVIMIYSPKRDIEQLEKLLD